MITNIKQFNEEVLNLIDSEGNISPIDSDQYEIENIVDVFTDVNDIKQLKENANSIATLNLSQKDVKRNDIIYIVAQLKPKTSSTAYPLGQMGVLQCRVLNTYFGLDKLKQLKDKNKLF